jgi:tRNA 2-thiouridine synthesizing protein A
MAKTGIDREMDTKDLLCPLPVVKAKLAIEEMDLGQVLRIEAMDKASPGDFAAWCKETGNDLLECGQYGDTFAFVIRKG